MQQWGECAVGSQRFGCARAEGECWGPGGDTTGAGLWLLCREEVSLLFQLKDFSSLPPPPSNLLICITKVSQGCLLIMFQKTTILFNSEWRWDDLWIALCILVHSSTTVNWTCIIFFYHNAQLQLSCINAERVSLQGRGLSGLWHWCCPVEEPAGYVRQFPAHPVFRNSGLFPMPY